MDTPATARSDFATRLFDKLARSRAGDNLFLSPFGIRVALAMCAVGARGETRRKPLRPVHHAGPDRPTPARHRPAVGSSPGHCRPGEGQAAPDYCRLGGLEPGPQGPDFGLRAGEGGGRPRFRQRSPVPQERPGGRGAQDAGGFAVGKPVLIEETFPLACSPKELEEFIEGSRKHAAGWIGFYWGKPPDELRRSKTISDALTLGWLELFERKAKALEK